MLHLPTAEAKKLLGVDAVLSGAITAWDVSNLHTANTIVVAAEFALVDLETRAVLWQGEQHRTNVSVRTAQSWHDVRYYVGRVVDEIFATLPWHPGASVVDAPP